MKANKLKNITLALVVAFFSVNCDNNDDNVNDGMTTGTDFSGTYVQQDQMARPAITLFLLHLGNPKTILMRLFHQLWVANTNPFFSLD